MGWGGEGLLRSGAGGDGVWWGGTIARRDRQLWVGRVVGLRREGGGGAGGVASLAMQAALPPPQVVRAASASVENPASGAAPEYK